MVHAAELVAKHALGQLSATAVLNMDTAVVSPFIAVLFLVAMLNTGRAIPRKIQYRWIEQRNSSSMRGRGGVSITVQRQSIEA
jgi:hypothetical protein